MLLRLMSRLIPLVLVLRFLSVILFVPLLILLLMRGLHSLVPRLILLLLRLMRGLLSLMPRLMLRLPLVWRAFFTVALAASAAIAASMSPAPTALAAASGFETSGQGMAAVGAVRAPVELFHADEATLQFGQTEICSQSNILFLGSIRGGETIQDSTANLLLCCLNVAILYVEG